MTTNFQDRIWGLRISKAIKGTTLKFEGVDDVHKDISLSIGVFSVSDQVPYKTFGKDLKNVASLFIPQTRAPFDTTTRSKSTNSRYGNFLNATTRDLTMIISTAFCK